MTSVIPATCGDAAFIELVRSGSDLVLRNTKPLEVSIPTTAAALDVWAVESPEAVFLAEREESDWNALTYGDAWERVRFLRSRLVALGCSGERPLAIISDNSVSSALLSLAAMSVGVPVAPISMAYATLATDFSRLRFMLELVGPGAIWFGQPERCGNAIAAVADIATILCSGPENKPGLVNIDLVAGSDEALVSAAAKAVGPATVAKLMFTSGSTGKPKAVINTQQMICSNQAMLQAIWPGLREKPPILVDWLPWSHTFGANFTFNLALFNGGALYIDGGKPTPQAIGLSLENLVHVRPTVYFNVPAGFEALLDRLRNDRAAAERIFSRMEFAFFAAAAIPQTVRNELVQLAFEVTGRHLPFLTGWGSTETAPCATATWWNTERSDNIGLPLPGIELRLAHDGNKHELRVRGPNVTPGYWNAPAGNGDIFDEDGFYRMGDAGALIDESAPLAGIRFDGRLSENFKLRSGTWVNVGAIRVGAVDAGRPLIRDAVVTGSGQADVGLLVFVNHQACRDLIGAVAQGFSDADVAAHPAIQAAIAAAIAQYNGGGRSSSTRVARFAILPDTPSIEKFEITDKGYINQRATLEARSAAVDSLYGLCDSLT